MTKLLLKITLNTFFKTSTYLNKNIKNNSVISVKYIIYYLLFIDYIKYNYNPTFSKNTIISIKKPYTIKKERVSTILYSPNRHKSAQKHFKNILYSIILTIEIRNYLNKSEKWQSVLIKPTYNYYINILTLLRLFLKFSLININTQSIKTLVSNNLPLCQEL